MKSIVFSLSSLLLLTVVSGAQASDSPFSLEGIAVRSQLATNIPGLDDQADGFGARIVYRFAGRLGFELQGSQVGFEGTLPSFGLLPVLVPVDLDLEMADVSLRLSLVRRSRFDLFVFGGVGYISADVSSSILGFSFRTAGETYTWHVGVGAEIGLGDRFFLRPDIRQRELPNDDEEGFVIDLGGGDVFRIDLDVEYSLSLGFRL